MRSSLLLATLVCSLLAAWACEPGQYQNGCMIYGNTCKCDYGCRTEYIYKTRRACSNALRAMQAAATAPPPVPERVSNICFNFPCARGNCIQTTNDPGFTCKCEGTGFYGKRCEKACPTGPIHGIAFPHECIVI